MVTHCICFDVAFSELKRVIEETGSQTVQELHTHIQFGENCELCIPYVKKIFATGQTAFAVEEGNPLA
jgi:NAD(P)H-nitrite reductase large subunit